MSTTPSVMNTYNRLPVEFDRGAGVWLYDQQGKAYLDGVSGVAVCSLGHCHPAVTQAITEQANKLVHTSNLYHIGTQEKLAAKLTTVSGMTNCFFSNSGAEANEAAIKLARLHGHKKGIEIPTVLVFDSSFHGRTMATLTASGNRKIQAGFEPLVKGFIRAPYNDIEAVKNIAKSNSDVVAILVEPVQGEGGVFVPAENYLTELRAICDAHDWLLMLDEVQTGNGRTGKYFAYQHYNWMPDVVTTAKGLGNGVPIGACLAHGKAAELFHPGNHGSTFGGNPLVCAAALATVNNLTGQGYVENAEKMGKYFIAQFQQKIGQHKNVKAIRGLGLMIGIELVKDCGVLTTRALDKGALINVTAGNVIRLLPALIINQEEADKLIGIVCDLVTDFE
jgi:acetylornithine/N-succinyldiaminopimelate aminotransferase